MKLWALLLWFVCSTASAQIGSVVDFTGSAVIKRGKETIAVSKGTAIQLNDRVETKNGVVNIKFKDDTSVKVTESSSLVIDDFVYDPKNAAGGKLSLKAAAGTVRYVSGKIIHENVESIKNIKNIEDVLMVVNGENIQIGTPVVAGAKVVAEAILVFCVVSIP